MEIKEIKSQNGEAFYKLIYDKVLWKQNQKDTYEFEKKNLSKPGFRKGHLPEEEVKKILNENYVIQKAINKAIRNATDFINKDEKIKKPLHSDFFFEINKATTNELEIVFSFIVKPEVNIDFLNTLKVKTPPKPRINEPELNTFINQQLKRYGKLEKITTPAKLGDVVNIDFIGKINNEKFAGGEAKNFNLELGSKQFIPGFEEQLINHKPNTEFEIKVKFPKNYPADDLKDKETTFDIKVNFIQEIKMPKIDDAFIEDLKIPNVKNLFDYRMYSKNELLKLEITNWSNNITNIIINEIVSKAKINIPQKILDSETKATRRFFMERAKQLNISEQDFAIRNGIDINNYDKEIHDIALNKLKLSLILREYINKNKLKLDENIVTEQYKKHCDANPVPNRFTKDEFAARFLNDTALQEITESIFKNSSKKEEQK